MAGAGAGRTVEVADLRTFCTAAETGSLGRAAVRLHVSQPALSKRLAALERLAGVKLLERSSRGVRLTGAGRRLYEEARRMLDQTDVVEGILAGIRRDAGPIRLGASHSAAEAFVAEALLRRPQGTPVVELVNANSQVVRGMVADGAVDVGVVASRPRRTPDPAVRETHLADDEVVCAVPREHPWARRGHVTQHEFLSTPMVVRDPQSNARWTVEAVLRRRGLALAAPLVQAPTPTAARREALERNAPLLLSKHVLHDGYFVPVPIDGDLRFPRAYALVLPGIGDPPQAVRDLVAELEEAVAGW